MHIDAFADETPAAPGSRGRRRRVRRSTKSAVLGVVRRTGVDLAIWERTMPQGLARWLDDLPSGHLPTGRFTSPVEAMAPPLAACWPEGPDSSVDAAWRRAWANDVLDLVHRFAAILGAGEVEVRLEAVSDDACSRFHADCVTLRLLTTYRGPGTQWIEPAAGLQPPHARCDPAEEDVRQLPRFAVGLFKGRRFPSAEPPAVLHRSPPVAATGITRLLLCLNPPASPADECCPQDGKTGRFPGREG
jgi:hypothetical protein